MDWSDQIQLRLFLYMGKSDAIWKQLTRSQQPPQAVLFKWLTNNRARNSSVQGPSPPARCARWFLLATWLLVVFFYIHFVCVSCCRCCTVLVAFLLLCASHPCVWCTYCCPQGTNLFLPVGEVWQWVCAAVIPSHAQHRRLGIVLLLPLLEDGNRKKRRCAASPYCEPVSKNGP